MTKIKIQAEALDRARNGQTLSNYPAIFAGFMEKGIPEADIRLARSDLLTRAGLQGTSAALPIRPPLIPASMPRTNGLPRFALPITVDGRAACPAPTIS
jgi:hypothetical protein